MEQKPVAIVLGGTVPHGEVIRELKRRGYYTVLVDYFAAPPAARFADRHIRESAMDEDKVLSLAEQLHAALVVSPCLDQQMNVAMKVSETLNLPHPFSCETAVRVTNKEWMKRIMMEAGIPTARYLLADEHTDLSAVNLTYPLIVKPDDSCGSAGVSVIETPGELAQAIRNAVGYGLQGKAIVEEYITGTEMGVHGYVRDGRFQLLFGTCKVVQYVHGIIQQVCNLYLPAMRDTLREQLEAIAEKIIAAFGLPDSTPLFIQVIVRDGKAYVIEFSPRCAGGTTSSVAKKYAGFDLLSCSIDSYLHQENPSAKAHRLEEFVCCFPIYCGEGVFSHAEGCQNLIDRCVVEEVILLKSPGDHITLAKPSSSNVLKYIITGPTWQECLEKMKDADAGTVIYGEDQTPLPIHHAPLTAELIGGRLSALL